MREYIDRHELLKAINANVYEAHNERCAQILEAILNAPASDVVEVKEGEILIPSTEEELHYLVNDTIAYIWNMEQSGRDKEEFGYYSRKELHKKLNWYLKGFEKPVCCSERREK